MQGRSEFNIIGRIGKITPLNGCLKISVAADYPKRDEGGDWQNNTHWSTVTVFGESTIKWANSKLKPGDLISTRGRLRESSYEKDGQMVYTVDLTNTELNKLASKEQLARAQDERDEAA